VLEELLHVPVTFVPDCIGESVRSTVTTLQPGSILVLENLRYHAGEKKNDKAFIESLISAINPDVYVNDAFGTAHRKHASVVGLPTMLRARAKVGGNPVPCVSGFLMGKEVRFLSESIPQARVPGNLFVAILGGAKVTSKLPVFKNLLPRVNKVLVGGAMALPFLKAKGHAIANVDDENVAAAQTVLDDAKECGAEIVLPVDFLTSPTFEDPAVTGVAPATHSVEDIPEGAFCLDIGPKTVEIFAEAVKDATTAVWNGPLGRFEWDAFSAGSIAMVEALSAPGNRTSIVGGGETAQVVTLAGKKHDFVPCISHVSTGGGASLEMLQGDELPAISALDAK
jgi:phosphoglycerate kinase